MRSNFYQPELKTSPNKWRRERGVGFNKYLLFVDPVSGWRLHGILDFNFSLQDEFHPQHPHRPTMSQYRSHIPVCRGKVFNGMKD